MNLHKDILKIIPLDGAGYRNARQGRKPEEFDDYINRLVSNFINLIKGLIMAIGRFIANIVEAIIKIGLSFLAAFTALLLALIEALLKAALIAFIYLEFALFIAGMTVLFSTFLASLAFITLIYGGSLTLDGFYLEYLNNYIQFVILLENFWIYNSFLEVDVPKSEFSIKINGFSFFEVKLGVIGIFMDVKYYNPLVLGPSEGNATFGCIYDYDYDIWDAPELWFGDLKEERDVTEDYLDNEFCVVMFFFLYISS